MTISLRQEQEWREWYLAAEDDLRRAADRVWALWEQDGHGSEAMGELIEAGCEAHRVWEGRRVAYDAFMATLGRQAGATGLTGTWREALGG